MPRIGADLPGVEPAGDDVEAALRRSFPDGGDIGETGPRFGNRVDGDVPAVTGEDDDHPVRTRPRDWRSDGLEAGGVGGGEGQRAERLRIVQAAGGDAAEVRERMLAARR